jgi:phage gp36-like protein
MRRLIGNPRKRNHGETAADVFEGFHGTPATRTEVYEDRILIEDSLAECGPLQSIRVKTVTGFTTTIKFDKDRQPILCSSPDRNQLYIVGGDQELDLHGLGFEGESEIKHLMKIGVAKQVTYFAKKGFDNFEPTDYFHDLGEENGVKPDLMYDAVESVSAVIDGYLTTVIETVPIVQTSTTLNRWLRDRCVDLACERLCGRKGKSVVGSIRATADWARNELEKVQNKEMRVPGLTYPGDGFVNERHQIGRPVVANPCSR